MANEITVTCKIAVVNGNHESKITPTSHQFDQAAQGAWDSIQNIGTSEESITSFGDVTTEGWCYLRNMDATNYVQWGFATGVYGGRMEAGEPAGPFRMEPATSLFLKANTAACDVRVVVYED